MSGLPEGFYIFRSALDETITMEPVPPDSPFSEIEVKGVRTENRAKWHITHYDDPKYNIYTIRLASDEQYKMNVKFLQKVLCVSIFAPATPLTIELADNNMRRFLTPPENQVLRLDEEGTQIREALPEAGSKNELWFVEEWQQ